MGLLSRRAQFDWLQAELQPDRWQPLVSKYPDRAHYHLSAIYGSVAVKKVFLVSRHGEL